MKKYLLASGNRHKIEELKAQLAKLGFDLKSALDYPGAEEVDEDQPNLEGNALKKARYWHQFTGLPSIADDTGLEVDTLNGAPGVRSARYAGEKATDEENVKKLLHELSSKDQRTARFRTVIALVSEDDEQVFHGVCEGEIINERRGGGGFGYDPVFVPAGHKQTFAELTPEQKNRISHRGRASAKLIDWLNSQV
ncbi:MAG: RdgB/HAM1 family non-canonical purine NTP pyrophosphatase [Balneolaceae bacterium]|nr:RdgB/HAM1 family non-canonical purine NTP pyrophosphatase [Balneolaceae bacterium]MCH8548971.1 RdgB/HAM1 family non-canonical purine NTP pyrophosphatase [Balneolaceae bacterium]